MKKRSKFNRLLSNIWRDKKTTVIGAIGAALLMVGQFLLGKEAIDWRIVLGAIITFVAGAITNTKTKDHGKTNENKDSGDVPIGHNPDDGLDFLQSEDSRYYKDNYR